MMNRVPTPVVVLLGCGLLVRLAVLLWYLSTHGWTPETWEYEAIAFNLLDRQEFAYPYYGTVYRSYIAPVFAFICYFLHLIGGRGFGLYFVFHFSIALLTIWLTYRLASRWFNERIGLLAGLLVCFEPGLVIYNSYKVEVVTLASCLLLIGLALFERMATREGMRHAVWFGLLAGAAILTRMDLVAVVAPFLVWIVLPPRPWRTILPRLVLVVALVVATLLPWLIRNYLVHGRPVFVTTTAWEQLWMGNYEGTTGTPVPLTGGSRIDFASPALKAVVATGTELEQYAAFRDEALRLIAADPAGFFLRAAKKFVHFWWFTPTYGLSYTNIPVWMREGYKALYALLLVPALLGGGAAMARAKGHQRFLVLSILSAIFAVVLLHSIYYVEGRHRVLVMPLVLMFSAVGLDRFLAMAAIKRQGSPTLLDLSGSPPA